MSDNPTLTTCQHGFPASRKDILAALPDKEWWCALWPTGFDKACTPETRDERQHDEFGCHWAVKP